jgi:hypothetical protein
MFLKQKYTSTGALDVLKSRFVAGGHRQNRSIYSENELSSPTVSLAAVYVTANIGAMEARKFLSMDVGSAYLNAEIKRDVYMRIESSLADLLAKIDPAYRELREADGSVIVKLQKALYGCVESAKLWFDHLTTKMKALGFTPNGKESCIMNRMYNGKQLTVCIYVDDLLCSCEDETALDWFLDEMTKEFHEIKSTRGDLHSYLGQTFDFSEDGKVRITMEGYIYDILESYDVRDFVVTPAQADLFDIHPESERLSSASSDEFHSRVARLLYLAKRVRPDILTAVIFLTTRVKASTKQDMKKLNRVLAYLNSTAEMGLVLEAGKTIQVHAYVDASYAVHHDFKSQTGGLITLGRGPIWAKSTRQKLNSKSSTEAELIGVSDVLSQVLWTRDYLIEQGYQVAPATVFQDNLSTMALANRGFSKSEKTRHIAIRYFFVKDRIESGEVALEHLSTDEMLADYLTKPLQGVLFRDMRRKLLNWEY